MAAVDELWLVCGVSPAEICAMPLDQVAFWHGRASAFFSNGKQAAPGSAVQALHTQHIEAFVGALRGRS